MPWSRSLPVTLVLVALSGSAGCERGAPPEAAGGPPAADAPGADTAGAAAAEIHAGLSWGARVTGAGVSLALFDPAGAPLLHLACVRDRAVMTLEVEAFTPIGSEERLSLGVDDEPYVFVADPTAERPSGVQAEAPISGELLDRMEGAREVSAVYGAQTLGPHLPPDRESGELFVSACRRITMP